MKQFMKQSIWMKTLGASLGLLIVLALVWQPPRVSRAAGPSIHLTMLAGGFNNPIGVDVYEPTGEIVASANYPSGLPNNLDMIHANGTHTPYSALSGLTNELKIATVRTGPCMGGFTVGDLFTGNGNPGQIVKVAAGGAVVVNPWVTLPGETAAIRGSLYQDRACDFGGDLIVVTANEQTDPSGTDGGRVWRINSAGGATKIAELPMVGQTVHLEGVITVPNNPAKYGPAAGRILAGAEDLQVSGTSSNPILSYGPNGRIYGIGLSPTLNGDVITIGASDGIYTNYATSSPVHPEDIDLMRRNTTFYGVAFSMNQLLTAPSTDFDAFCDDILITQEFPNGGYPYDMFTPQAGVSGLSVLKWNGGSFDITQFDSGNVTIKQWEHVTFLTGSDCAASKGITIGPSSMEGDIKISAGDFVNGGYSFKTNFTGPITIAANVSITGKCIAGSVPLPPGTTDTLTVPLGSIGYNAVAGSDWKPTGDANSILSWQGDVVAPATLCGGNGAKLDGSKGAIFNASISGAPLGGLVTFRFKFRDPAAKNKPNTNCTDKNDPNRNRADVCGASWSETRHDP
jgi:hypothetical protein